MKLTYLILIFITINAPASISAQSVSITIDDVPNNKKILKDNCKSELLNTLDSLNIPIAIFINESRIFKSDSISEKFNLLHNWIKRDYISLGNHTFLHSRYSEVGLEAFKTDIEKGENITRELSKKYNKSLKHFRFPYNDLGKDSLQHIEISNHLIQKGYTITPFTIESLDWMYNFVYEYYLNKNEIKKANEIATEYVEKTLDYFDFFEKLALEKYNRPINQIYMCHDNILNAHYLSKIIDQLRLKNYSFISLDAALEDEVYNQKDRYSKKWGISWFYRWMKSQEEITSYMKKEPSTENIENLYSKFSQE